MFFPANLFILFFLLSCSKGQSKSLTLDATTIVFWCFLVLCVCAFLTFFYLKSYVKNLNVHEEGAKGYGYALTKKFYEILGFFISVFALLFAIISMINSERIDSAQLERPDFEVTAERYIFGQEHELKLVIKIIHGRIPRDCKIEFFPIFRLFKDTGPYLTKKDDDFSHTITRKFDLVKDKELDLFKKEILGLMKYMCRKPAYSGYCNKVKMGGGKLVEIPYRIFYKIGYSDVIELRPGKIYVIE